MKLELSILDHLEIIKKYISGETTKQIAKSFGVGYTTIFKVLDYHKIPKRNPNDLNKIPLNENYFEKINTEDKAYFLGWLYADGNISQDKKYIKLVLNKKDRNILEILNTFITNEKIVYDYREYACLVLCRTKIAEDLIKLGCVPAKTFVIKFPTTDQVPAHLIRHFFRGYFDGDGSIGYFHKGSGRFFANFVGTNDFCESLCTILKEFNPTIKYIKEKINEKGTTVIRFMDYNVIRLGDFLYANHKITLNRKFEKFIEILKIHKNKTSDNKNYNREWVLKKNADITNIINYYLT